MSPRVRDLLGSVLTIVALVSVLILVDQRVRGRVGGAATEIATEGLRTPAAVNDLVTTGWTQYGTNTYLIAFFITGIVLVCLMLRT